MPQEELRKLAERSGRPLAQATRVTAPVDSYSSIDTGSTHTCASSSIGTSCWGSDADGRLGNGDGDTAPHLTPVLVIPGDSVRELSLGFDHTCALGTDRRLRCWGRNEYGQLGLDDLASRSSPTELETNAFNSAARRERRAARNFHCARACSRAASTNERPARPDSRSPVTDGARPSAPCSTSSSPTTP